MAAIFVGQLITIPLALWFQFKVAYIFTYIFGYVYGCRYENGKKFKNEQKILDVLIVIIAILGWLGRAFLETRELTGIWENAGDLFVQWIKLFQGAGLFIIPYRLIVKWKENRAIHRISGVTYEVYLVHELFVHDFITQFYPDGTVVRVFCAWVLVAISTWMLVKLNGIKWRSRIEESSIPRSRRND